MDERGMAVIRSMLSEDALVAFMETEIGWWSAHLFSKTVPKPDYRQMLRRWAEQP